MFVSRGGQGSHTWFKWMDGYQASASPDDGSIVWNQECWSIFNMQGRVHQGAGLRKTATLNKRVEQAALYLQPRGISRIWCLSRGNKGTHEREQFRKSGWSLMRCWIVSARSVVSDHHTETFDYRQNTYCDKSSEESRWIFFFVIFYCISGYFFCWKWW